MYSVVFLSDGSKPEVEMDHPLFELFSSRSFFRFEHEYSEVSPDVVCPCMYYVINSF